MIRLYFGILALLCSQLSCLAETKAFGSLAFGDSKELVGRKLKSSKLVKTSLDESLIGRTGINGIYKLKQTVGGLKCSLYFSWDKEEKLSELSMQSETVLEKDFASARQCWSAFNKVLSKRHGSSKTIGRFPAISDLKDGQIATTHMWKTKDKRTFLLGVGNDQGEYSVVVVIRPK